MDLLPAAGALAVIQEFLAETNEFRRFFDDLIACDELDCSLLAKLMVRNQTDGFDPPSF